MALKPILTLDIGSHTLKLAEFVNGKNGLEMTRYAVTDLGLPPGGDVGERDQYIITAIHELLNESGAKPGPVQIAVAKNELFSRFVKLPAVEPEKVYQIIQYEAQQNVPFPMDEVVWDYQLIHGADGDVDVMIAAIKKDAINHLVDCVKFAGLTPERIDIAPMALYNAVRYNRGDLPGCTMVVDIGAHTTDILFLENGRVFTRSVPVAGNTITQNIMNEFNLSFDAAEDMKRARAFVAFGGAYEGPKSETDDKVSKCVRSVMTRLHQEVNRSINFYRSQQGGQQPTLLLLTGGSSIIRFADSFFREKLRIQTDYFNPFGNIAVADSIPEDDIVKHVCEMGVNVGLALRVLHICPIELNLIPESETAAKAFNAKKPLFAIAAVAALAVLGIGTAFYAKQGATVDANADEVEARKAQLERAEKGLIATEREEKAVEDRILRLLDVDARRGVWHSIYAEIASVVPDGMWISAIRPITETRDGADAPVLAGVQIEGAAYVDKIPPVEAAPRLRDALRALPMFSEGTEVTFDPQVKATVKEFRIEAKLEEPQAL